MPEKKINSLVSWNLSDNFWKSEFQGFNWENQMNLKSSSMLPRSGDNVISNANHWFYLKKKKKKKKKKFQNKVFLEHEAPEIIGESVFKSK